MGDRPLSIVLTIFFFVIAIPGIDYNKSKIDKDPRQGV